MFLHNNQSHVHVCAHLSLYQELHKRVSPGSTVCPNCKDHGCTFEFCENCLYHLSPGHLPHFKHCVHQVNILLMKTNQIITLLLNNTSDIFSSQYCIFKIISKGHQECNHHDKKCCKDSSCICMLST